MNDCDDDWRAARDEFIAQWGALGGAWGINRTMAQIHALLLVSPRPLTTQDVMDELQISRGNANTNLRDLVGWGLVRSHVIKGDRKDYYEAEKDVWKMFCTVVRERKRREVEPALELLRRCAARTKNPKDPAAEDFHHTMNELAEFVALTDQIMEAIARSEKNRVLPSALKLLGSNSSSKARNPSP